VSVEITLKALSEEIGAVLKGDSSHVVNGCATLTDATSQQLSFIYNKKYTPALLSTNAGVVVLSEDYIGDCPTNALVVKNPYLAYAQAATILHSSNVNNRSIHSTAVIADTSVMPKCCYIGAQVVIADNVQLGDRCSIGAGVIVEEGVKIGDDAQIFANVTVCKQVNIGHRAIIHPGAVIGSDGFGLAPKPSKQGWQKIPQIGSVIIGNDVEIGANTTIDRGALEDTLIGNGVKIDNQVMIAHNVSIGDHTAIAGCAGIAGSTEIGKHCTLAGGVGLVGHITIADGVHITGMTMVTHSIKESGAYSSGTPFQKNSDWLKNAVRFKQLDKLSRKINQVLKK
jgi:UDP-3-O-[3-hydroxymyristoyl] glucosamine N-acyltransferase